MDSPFFQGFPHFSKIFGKIIKFHDFSMTGKTVIIFPGVLGTLNLPDVDITPDHGLTLTVPSNQKGNVGTRYHLRKSIKAPTNLDLLPCTQNKI